MPVKSYVLGPGTLTLGAGALAITAQVASMAIKWTENLTEGDVIPLLDGSELRDEDQTSYRAVLAGNLVQDITAGGIVDWSWTNKGTEQAFTFVPNTVEARQVTGTLVPVPIDLGGDVKKRNRSDLSWRCTVDPALAAVPVGP